MHQGRGGQSMVVQQLNAPVVVQVALLPAKVTEENWNQPVQGEFMMSSVERYNSHGEHQTVAEYLKYLVEQACPEFWLLPICRHAQSTTGAVKLCYGCGYETTVVIGNADSRGEPKKLALGASVNTTNATVGEIAGLWMSGSESIWNHVIGQIERNIRSGQDAGNVCVYVRTGPRRFMIPALSADELHSRHRMVRVWPDPDNDMFIERMEELSSESLNAPTLPAAASPPETTSKTKKDKSTSKNKSSSTHKQTEEAKKPPSKKDEKAMSKKRSVSTDEGAEDTKSKKSKKSQDKDKPKQALTAYNLYMKDNRARITKENPTATSTEVTKLLAAEYKNMSEEELKAYRPQVEADKKRYDLEMQAWEAKQESKKAKKEAEDKERSESKSDGASSDTDPDEDDAGRSDEESLEGERKKPAVAEATAKTASKKKKDPTKPKGGKSAYNFFLAEKKQEFEEAHPGKDWPRIRTLLIEAFHSLGKEERTKYDAMATADKEKRDNEMAEWIAEKAAREESGSDEDEEVEKKKAKRKKKDPEAPKRARSAFIFFSTHKREAIKKANPNASFGDMGKLIGDAFKAMSAKEKAKYDAMAAADKIRAKREMEEYKANKAGGMIHDEENQDRDDKAQSSNDVGSDKIAASKPATEKPKETTTSTETSDAELVEETAPAEAVMPRKTAAETPESKSKKRKLSEDKSVKEALAAEKSMSKKKKKTKKKKHCKSDAVPEK